MVRVFRLPESGLLRCECLIHENSALLQRLRYIGDEGTVEIAEDKDCAEGETIQRIDAFLFEVHLHELYGNPGCPRVQHRLTEGFFRPVSQNN